MADVFDKAYGDRESLIADLKLAFEREGVAADESFAVCEAIKCSPLISEGQGVVGYRLPEIPRGTSGPGMSMLLEVPVIGRGIVFNGKNAAVKLGITAAGTFIGGPAGFLALLQNLVGWDFAVIEYENGMVCNLATLHAANTPMSVSSLWEETKGKDCIRPKSDCRYRHAGRCEIDDAKVQENLTRLEERKAVDLLVDSYRAVRL